MEYTQFLSIIKETHRQLNGLEIMIQWNIKRNELQNRAKQLSVRCCCFFFFMWSVFVRFALCATVIFTVTWISESVCCILLSTYREQDPVFVGNAIHIVTWTRSFRHRWNWAREQPVDQPNEPTYVCVSARAFGCSCKKMRKREKRNKMKRREVKKRQHAMSKRKQSST